LTKVKQLVAQAVKAQRQGDRASARQLLELALAQIEELSLIEQNATKGPEAK